MKPAPSIYRPKAFAAAALTVVNPINNRINSPILRPAKGIFQLRTQGVLEYLAETLRKAW